MITTNQSRDAFFSALPERLLMRDLGAAIDLAMAPFHPGRITAHVNDRIAHGRSLIVEVETLPEHHFVMSLDSRSIIAEPDGGLSKIYERVFRHYRYREALPLDDHIVPGED